MADAGPLEAHLRARRDAGRKLLVPYVTGGLGDDWPEVVRAFADAGADAIEIGIPFSDPVMDGPTIQEASEAALAQGANLGSILDALRDVDAGVPLVAMTYVNLVFHAGYQRFAAEAVAANIQGVILPDLPMEELDEWEPHAEAAGLETVLLASPLTPDERLDLLCRRSRGFVYGVNLLGVTGERTALADSSTVLAQRLKRATDLPVAMGFGISSPALARAAAEHADGVVVASALMRMRLDGAAPEDLGAVLAEYRAALDA
ncbi:MAG TPA: tryptophan synthase subunit alpha [Acidimicrobiales bacterium]|nr:tryptophan synthase subunit alpha [Acidimicrobiales bacterium]